MTHIPSSTALHQPGWFYPEPEDERTAVAEWQRLLDLGLIGKRAAPDPEIVAKRNRTAAQFEGYARARRLGAIR